MSGLWERLLTARLLLMTGRRKRGKMNISEIQYKYAEKRVAELLKVVNYTTLPSSPESIELSIMGDVVEEYEKRHYPMKKLTVAEVIKQGLKAKGMTQRELAEALGMSTSRISDYAKGKSEPTLATAGKICRLLGILPSAMLNV